MRNSSALWASHKAAAHDGEKTGVDSRTGSHNRTTREWNVDSSHSQDNGVLYGDGFTVDQVSLKVTNLRVAIGLVKEKISC